MQRQGTSPSRFYSHGHSHSTEDVGHQPVVVLPGMDQRMTAVRHPPAPADLRSLGDDRGHLDEVRPRAEDVGDPHGGGRAAAWANARRRGSASCGAAIFGTHPRPAPRARSHPPALHPGRGLRGRHCLAARLTIRPRPTTFPARYSGPLRYTWQRSGAWPEGESGQRSRPTPPRRPRTRAPHRRLPTLFQECFSFVARYHAGLAHGMALGLLSRACGVRRAGC
jgi:hypothetical protein